MYYMILYMYKLSYMSTLRFQVIEDRHSTSSLESSVNESHPPNASLGASLQSIPTSHTPLGQQQTQATAATPTAASAPVATPTLATPTPAPQHNTALQRAVSCQYNIDSK